MGRWLMADEGRGSDSWMGRSGMHGHVGRDDEGQNLPQHLFVAVERQNLCHLLRRGRGWGRAAVGFALVSGSGLGLGSGLGSISDAKVG